jgi:hypothetical protein
VLIALAANPPALPLKALPQALFGFEGSHRQSSPQELFVVKLGLLLWPDPNDRQTFKMNLIGEFYCLFRCHFRNVGDETFCHMFKGIKVIVEYDDFVIWVQRSSGLTACFNLGCRKDTTAVG